MAESREELEGRVRAWIADDPDETTRAELEALLESVQWDELAQRFDGRLQFGTAGLRGLLGAGPMRMNRVTVQRATAGLCKHLLASVDGAKERGVVIGYDARRMSTRFAQDVAEVVSGFGIRAYLFDEAAPTPAAGFAVLAKNAGAGVVVTASHNPPDYNGYKVFWENGAQIIPPVDGAIAAAIDGVENVRSLERTQTHIESLGVAMRDAYLKGALEVQQQPAAPRDLCIAYSAMHGVGGKYVKQTLKAAGFHDVHEVEEQAAPDGRFPTVAFPNPEEDGAMDLVLALASAKNAELVLANDPDADRLAASVRHGAEYVALSGNEIGCLLAHYLLEHSEGEERAILSSVVSSPMLFSIGEAHGIHAEQTLTGHKWIQNRALALKAEGKRVIFGYEEALGYAVSDLVRDKDGITAALCLAEMAAWAKAKGKTLIDVLAEMARRYGLFLSDQISVVLPGTEGQAQIDGRMAEMRSNPPKQVAGCTVLAVQDFLSCTRTDSKGERTALTFPKANVLLFELEGGHRAMLRPSGTEPKLKHYIDVRVSLNEGETVDEGRTRGAPLLAAIAEDFVAR